MPPSLNLMLAGLSGLLFSLQGAALKVALARGIGAFQVVAIRGSIQALTVMVMLVPLAKPQHSLLARTWPERRLLLLRALLGYTGIGFGFAALERLPLGDAAAIGFVSPVFSITFAWIFLGERIGLIEALAAAGSCVGIVLVAQPAALFGDAAVPPDAFGVLLALCGALGAGAVTVVIRKLAKSMHWTIVLWWQGLGQAIVSPPVALALGRTWGSPDRDAAFVCLALLLGGLCAVGGYVPEHSRAPLPFCNEPFSDARVCLRGAAKYASPKG